MVLRRSQSCGGTQETLGDVALSRQMGDREGHLSAGCAQEPPCGWEGWCRKPGGGCWTLDGPYLVGAEDLQGVAGRQLQLNQFLILCFNHLQELSVFNVQLLKINFVEGLAYLFLLQLKRKDGISGAAHALQPAESSSGHLNMYWAPAWNQAQCSALRIVISEDT